MRFRRAPSDGVVLVGLVLVGFAIGKLQTTFRNSGRVDPISGTIQSTVRPVASTVTTTVNSVSAFFGGIGHSMALESENARLRAQVFQLSQYQSAIDLAEAQLDNVRRLDGFKNSLGRKTTAARIIEIFPFENRVTLDVGSSDGVAADMPVMTGYGLMGVVQTVTSKTCQVEMISSPNLKIAAIIPRQPPSAGLLRGETPSSLILEFVDPKAAAAVGDEVVTSGFSDRIPRGIPIGRIYRIEDNPDFGEKRAFVYPWSTVGSAAEVFVVQ